MISRRKLLGGLAAGAAVGSGALLFSGQAASGTTPGASRKAAAGLPLTVVNKTGAYDNSSIAVYIVGNEGGRQVRVTPDGTLAPVSLSDNGPDGFTDYAIPLAGGGDTRLTLPKMSGRIYVALGGRLKFKAVADGNGNPALQYPAGWVESDPSYDVLHDCAEFTYNDDGMFCNTTMVDMFSVPLSIRLTGAKDQTAGELRAGGRAAVFRDLARHDAFAPLVLGEKRVLAPGHGLDSGLFDRDYLAGAIGEAWNHYTGTDLRVTTNAGTFTGRVSGGRFAFTGPAAVSFDRPTTRDVLFCDGALAAPNDGTTGPVAAILGAALNRSVLRSHPSQPVTDPAAFYQREVTNHYARALHEVSADGKAYGFAFDDVAGFAPYIEDGAPSGFTLTLDAF
ncbi:beta-1,3-glucanase family protein [Streptomyces sp. WAC 00631]|uniref:beta-1,3-glucanase family protein n=1 Tax=Streptomyces sp. WAC 00631 TaxID=2203201 RepID=UPI000F7B968D|nr:beta-1,3-glucanase family protein [Streptomyces sp. WAC 00631]MCC5034307.1 beta-1,3-glucanase family protein [Streptomyces sp. WAC 00631]